MSDMADQQNNTKKYTFNILKEEAENTDLFEGKTHEKVASTLEALITDLSTEGLTIGLEGTWGSGKSTVISILKQKISTKDDFLYFYFDAWAHEGDPLRRIFLESLINKLGCTDQALLELKKEISNRRKKSKSTIKQTVTTLGKLISIAAFFVPLGVALISRVDISKLTFSWTGNPSIVFISGVILSILPILVLTSNAILVKTRKKNIFDIENWLFLQGEKIEETDQEVSEEEERTSIEFENYFKRILNEIFHKNPSKKLIIVIDNLDRIDASDSLKIWSTLQTFLQQRNPSNSDFEWYKRIWIIVPYDSGGLSKLWAKNPEIIDDDPDIKSVNCAKAFFDKCFQLRLEVPKPILSGWEAFAKDNIDYSFASWELKEREEILNILRLTRGSLNDIPTPREIKTYINQIGIIRINADSAITTQGIAYYAVCKYLKFMTNDEIASGLLQNNLPYIDYVSNIPRDLVMNVAGLLFGVSPQRGQEILLEPEIENLLLSAKGDELKQLCENHGNGFWIVFNFHITKIDNLGILIQYSEAILNGLWENHRKQCNNYIERIKSRIMALLELGFPDNTLTARYEATFKLLDESGFDFSYVWKILISMFNNSIIEKSNLNYNDSIIILSKLREIISSKEIPQYELENLPIGAWDKIAESSESNKINSWEWLRPEQAIVQQIAALFVAGQPFPSNLAVLIDYSVKAGIKDWRKVVLAVQENISWNNGTQQNDVPSLHHIIILLYIALNESISETEIKNVVQTGPFHNLVFHLGDHIGYPALLTAIYFPDKLYTDFIPNIANSLKGLQIEREFWATHNSENATFVWNIISQYNTYPFLWELLSDSRNLLVSDIIELALKENNRDFLPKDNTLTHLRNVIAVINDNDLVYNLIKTFIENSPIEEEIINNNNLVVEDYAHELFLLISHSDNIGLLYNLSLKVRSISKEAWDNSFAEATSLLFFVLKLKSKVSTFTLENTYYDSLLDYTTKWGDNSITPGNYQKDYWKALLDILGSSFKTRYKERFTDYISEKRFIVNEEIVKLNTDYIDFQKLLTDRKTILQDAVEAATKSEGNLGQLRVIDFIFSQNINFKFSPDSHIPDIIRQPIQILIKSSKDEDTTNLLYRIADYFNVKIDLSSEEEPIEADGELMKPDAES